MKIISAEFIISAFGSDQFPPPSQPEIAFVGRSNVGKSSLLNCLSNRKKLAKISSTPGKTRSINFFHINQKFYFVDLPGYGYARVSKEMQESWSVLIEDYLRERETLRLIVQLVDMRHPPSAGDKAMYKWLVHFNRPTVIVATKADKISRGKQAQHINKIRDELGLGQGTVIPFSVETGQGKEELWRWLAQYLI